MEAITLRRMAALLVDLLVPGLPAAVAAGATWLVARPDLAQDMAALGAALVVTLAGTVVWLALFVTNEIIVAASKRGTVGERLYGFRLDASGTTGGLRLKLAGRATLRFGVAVVVLSIFGLATEQVGENAIGVAVAVVVSVAFLALTCAVGAQGPTTVLERMCRLSVLDERGADATNEP